MTTVVAQFGQMEALDGTGRLAQFVASYHRLLDEFAKVTRRVVLVSPMPFEKPLAPDAPDLRERNLDVKAYVEAVREVAKARGAVFVDLYTPLAKRGAERLTENGVHLTARGLREVGLLVADSLRAIPESSADLGELREAIVEKNRFWFDCWRPANWSFVYGDRVSQLYGKGGGSEPTLQAAFERQLPLVAAGDARIAALAKGEEAAAVEVPVREVVEGPAAVSPEEEMASFTMADGYAVNLFASEADGGGEPGAVFLGRAGAAVCGVFAELPADAGECGTRGLRASVRGYGWRRGCGQIVAVCGGADDGAGGGAGWWWCVCL